MLKKNQKGFTIIEVLIVLAIAGLIMLIVFLAVPGLQRSSRNNARKNDASHLSAAVSDFVSNANGTMPGGAAYTAGQAKIDAATILKDVNLAQLSLTQGGSAMAANTLAVINGGVNMPATADNEVGIYLGDTCNGAVLSAGTTREAALIYPIEQSGGSFAWSCIDAL